MSHYAVVNVKIIDPNRQLLLKALHNIAEKLGGRVAEDIVVYGFNFSKRCNYAVLVNLPYGNGYGVELTSDGIKVHVDDHGAVWSAEKFAEELVKEYTALALEQVLGEMGYTVNRQLEGEKLILYAMEGW